MIKEYLINQYPHYYVPFVIDFLKRHGNEPDHQTTYLFAMACRPDKTQEWVNKIINDEYTIGPVRLSKSN